MGRLIFAIVTVCLMVMPLPAEKVLPIIQNGEPAPIFMLPDLNGKRISLRDYCGKLRNPWKNKTKRILILSFMASYCVPCRHEIPQLEAYAKDAPDDVKVVYVSIDTLGKRVLDPFVKKMNIMQPVLSDRYGNVMKKYGVKKLPSLFIIDKEGKMQFQSLNGLPPDLDLKAAITKKIDAILAADRPGGPVSAIPPHKKAATVKELFAGQTDAQIIQKLNISQADLTTLKAEILSLLKGHWKVK